MVDWSQSQVVVLPISLAIIVLITTLFGVLLRNKSDKIKNVPLIIIAATMLILEVIKQLKQIGDYSLWSIPLHFCSTYMIWFSMAAFGKGKIKSLGQTLSVTSAFLFLFTFYISPSSIIGSATDAVFGSFSSFHTFIYHHFIILFLGLMLALRQYKPEKRHFLGVFVCFTVYAILAVFFAHTLDVNFASLLNSNVGFMQNVINNYGYYIYTPIMYSIALGGLFSLLGISLLICKLKTRQKK